MTVETAETAPDGHTEDSDSPAGTETSTSDSEAPRGNREARYRVERNTARDALAAAEARIEALQTKEVLRLAGEHLADPNDLLALGGVSLADLLDDDGHVSADALAEAAASVIETRPGLARNPKVSAVDRLQGRGSTAAASGPSWADVFKID